MNVDLRFTDKEITAREGMGLMKTSFLDHLEQKALPYIVALKLTAPLQRALVDAQGRWTLGDGIELVSLAY